MSPIRRPTPSLANRRRAAQAALALAAVLVVAGVVLAIGAEPMASAERIRPLSEAVDAALDRIRYAGRVQLVVGALLAGVLYALAAVWLGDLRRRRRRGAAPPE